MGYRVIVSSTFTADPLVETLSYWLGELGHDATVEIAPYHQVFQHLLDERGPLFANRSGIDVVLFRLEDWQGAKPAGIIDELIAAVRTASPRISATLMIVHAPASRAFATDPESRALLEDTDRRLLGLANELTNLICIPREAVAALAPANYDDPRGDRVAAIPYTPEMYAALATLLARRIHVAVARPYKVIALDCDNTLWSGVIGEDGRDGIAIGPAHLALQRRMLALHDEGMLLCLCSKNEDEDVWSVLQDHPAMVLRPHHVVARRVNWNRKPDNLRELAAELDLALDAFICIDDNPLECAEVRARHPDVLVLELPADPSGWARFLDNVWAFDRLRVTDEDRARTQLYAHDVQRKQLLSSSASLDTFLDELELRVDVAPVAPAQYARASELSRRTTQFNTSGLQLTEADVAARSRDPRGGALATTARDRFGNYGLIGLMLYATRDTRLEVDLMLVSCRALGKGIEHHMVRELARVATTLGAAELAFEVTTTARNLPARRFLEALGSGSVAGWRTVSMVEAQTCEQRVATLVDEAESPAVAAELDHRVTGRVATLIRAAGELSSAAAVVRAVKARRGPEPAEALPAEALETSTEQIVAEIWAEELGVARIDRTDDFFKLGGSSLKAVMGQNSLSDRFEVELPVTLILEVPRLSELAARIDALREQTTGEAAITRREIAAGSFPASHVQQRLWLVEQLGGHNLVLEILQIRGELDAAALARSWAMLVSRHAALQTTFDADQGTLVQRVAVRAPAVLERMAAPELDAVIGALRERRFELTVWPPFAAVLVTHAANAHVLVLALPHILVDGWSTDIVFDELAQLYRSERTGDAQSLPALAIDCVDFALWQRSPPVVARWAERVPVWCTALAGAPPSFELFGDPAGRRQGAGKGSGRRSITFAPELVRAMRAHVQARSATLFHGLFAMFVALLHRYSGASDLVVGVPVDNRGAIATWPIVGCFMDHVPVRVRVDDRATFSSLLEVTRQASVLAFSHAVPFDVLLAELKPGRVPGRDPIFQVMFNVESARVGSGAALEGCQVERSRGAVGSDRLDLNLSIGDTGEVVTAALEFARDLLTEDMADQFLAQYATLLAVSLSSPDVAIGDLSLSADEDQAL
ncbi:hypothetical protein BH11MYX1_BH11MYX1_23480 [soil metagenome]